MFGKNAKVDIALNRDVEQLIKTGGKEQILPIVQAGEPVLRQQTAAYAGQLSKRTLTKLIDAMHTTMIEARGWAGRHADRPRPGACGGGGPCARRRGRSA